MANQVRSFQCTLDGDNIEPLTISVPLIRNVVAAVEGNGGPAIMIQGDWSLPLPTNVTYTWLRYSACPYTLGAGETVVAECSLINTGFHGVVIAS